MRHDCFYPYRMLSGQLAKLLVTNNLQDAPTGAPEYLQHWYSQQVLCNHALLHFILLSTDSFHFLWDLNKVWSKSTEPEILLKSQVNFCKFVFSVFFSRPVSMGWKYFDPSAASPHQRLSRTLVPSYPTLHPLTRLCLLIRGNYHIQDWTAAVPSKAQ